MVASMDAVEHKPFLFENFDEFLSSNDGQFRHTSKERIQAEELLFVKFLSEYPLVLANGEPRVLKANLQLLPSDFFVYLRLFYHTCDNPAVRAPTHDNQHHP